MAAAAAPPSTPTVARRANVPSHVKDWIFSKACLYQYYDEIRTKEEKQLFIQELTKKLNSRFGAESGEWDENRTGNQVRNLKKERIATPRKESQAIIVAQQQKADVSQSLSPVEQLLLDWQATLITTSRLNSTNLARHSTNRGSCNEDLVKGFLSSVLASKYIGIGCGELLCSGETASRLSPRQADIFLYNPEFPCLMPARFASLIPSSSGCACYYAESVMAIIEVKTTLTNQDLRDVATAARMFSPIAFIVFAFDSQVSLKAIDVSLLPQNVLGIFTLSHGSIVAEGEQHEWKVIHPSNGAPLIQFYDCVLQALAASASNDGNSSLLRVLQVLEKQRKKTIVVVERGATTRRSTLCIKFVGNVNLSLAIVKAELTFQSLGGQLGVNC